MERSMSSTAAKPEKKVVKRVGVVESDARSKTRKVVINFLAKHPKYGKYMRKRTVLHVHDEQNLSVRADWGFVLDDVDNQDVNRGDNRLHVVFTLLF